ncbi:MAG: ATP-binding protein, partial [Chloroflexi bacterium]|nr:ATP-binding protein [Chloroflexota bacterium]
RLLEDIAAEAERLTRMIENLLEVSREEGAGRLTVEPVALRPLLRGLLRRMRPALGGRRVVCRVPPGLPPLEADPVALEQVIGNLLDNAARYTPPGAPVSVTARRLGGQVALRVADRGAGIPPEDRERAFAPFVRLGCGDRQGMGLGLAVCRRLIEAQGGTIHVEGRRAGPGAAVVVMLPAAQE